MKNFLKCGIMGWCFECIWTGFNSYKKKKSVKLECNTSLWMFLIYGMACIISPIYKLIKYFPGYIRGSIYTLGIFATEYFTGSFLKKHNACPWDYSESDYNIKGLIRLDYAPLWFIAGLIYEKFLCSK